MLEHSTAASVPSSVARETRREGFDPFMDPYGAHRRVLARVQAVDPDNSTKIMGYFMLHDNGDQEIYRLALGSDAMLQSMMARAKKDLGLTSRGTPPPPPPPLPHVYEQLQLQQQLQHFSAQSPTQQLSAMVSNAHVVDPDRIRRSLYIPDEPQHPVFNFVSPVHDHQLPLHDKLAGSLRDKLPSSYHDQLFLHDQQQQQQQQQLPMHDQLLLPESPDGGGGGSLRIFPNEHLYPETLAFLNSNKVGVGASAADHLYSRSSSGRRNSPLAESSGSPTDIGPALAWKPCLYFARGYCKHGSNCRFLHGPVGQNSGGSSSSSVAAQRDLRGDDGIVSGSLERLEMELQELLRGRRAPVSIASLPQLYYERFGKTLQAEGYLTESQRHGKAGYSLTKLLARLKNTVTLIDRPHGQHAVVLAEDAHRFTAFRGERDDLSGVNPSSRQIYLTFPAESSFTEEDVTSYFRAYGPVQDVRIPYQQKRMFGFVTFVYSETVKAILSEGNPHYICGARVLVKPYREKGKHGDRKYSERDHPRYQQGRGLESKDFDFSNSPTAKYVFDDEEAFARRLDEEEQSPYHDRRRIGELHLAELQRRRAEAEVLLAAQQAHAQAQVRAQAHQNLSNGVFTSDDLSLPAEELPQFHSDNTFEYLLDVLDGENGDEGDSANDNYSSILPTSGVANHNLPESPFTSPQALNKQQMAAFSSLPEKMKSLGIGTQSSSWTPYHSSAATLFASNVF